MGPEEELMTGRDNRSPIERAYRRGAHQTLAVIDRFIHEHLSLDPAAVLDVAVSVAHGLRYTTDDVNFHNEELKEALLKHFAEQIAGNEEHMHYVNQRRTLLLAEGERLSGNTNVINALYRSPFFTPEFLGFDEFTDSWARVHRVHELLGPLVDHGWYATAGGAPSLIVFEPYVLPANDVDGIDEAIEMLNSKCLLHTGIAKRVKGTTWHPGCEAVLIGWGQMMLERESAAKWLMTYPWIDWRGENARAMGEAARSEA
jgi:hypothetical protein